MKVIIFDCFGVLLTNTYILRYERLSREDPDKAQQLSDINLATDKGLIARPESERLMSELLGMTVRDFEEEEKLGEHRNEELIAFIRDLRKSHRTAMLSNVSGRERLELRFPDGELDQLFELVVASGDEGCAKPDPEIYIRTATRLGVLPEDCLMVDDNSDYCEGAVAVGMQVIRFIDTQQCINDITLLLDRGQVKV